MDDEEPRLVTGYVGYGVRRFHQVEALADRAAHQQRLRRIGAFMSEGADSMRTHLQKVAGAEEVDHRLPPAPQWNALRNVRGF
jgi:hypothetical protein